MVRDIDSLVASYEHGRLTRRQLLQALAVLSTPAALAAQPAPNGLMKGRMLHHVNVRMSDVARSEAFYRQLLGTGPSRVVQGPDNHGLDLPGGGLIILQKSEPAGRIDHFCVGVDHFDADRMRTAVQTAGIGAVQGTGADNFLVADPDGLRVQVSASDWNA